MYYIIFLELNNNVNKYFDYFIDIFYVILNDYILYIKTQKNM